MQNDIQPGKNAADAGHNGDAEAGLDPNIQDAIGRSLKAHYDAIVNAPVPDRFMALLAELEAKEQSDGS